MKKFLFRAFPCTCILSLILLLSISLSLASGSKTGPQAAPQLLSTGSLPFTEHPSSDLLHRDYGETAIKAQKDTCLSFDLEETDISPTDVIGIYAHHFETEKTTKLASKLKSFEYQAPESGHYMIYLLTKNGEITDISRDVAVLENAEIHTDAGDSPWNFLPCSSQ